jgi:flagellar motor protein MotB
MRDGPDSREVPPGAEPTSGMDTWWQDRGQLLYPPEFRIPRPLWPDDARSDYEAVAAAFAEVLDRSAPEPDGLPTDDALADAVLRLWRTHRRIAHEDPDGTSWPTRRLRRYIDTAWRGLGWAGVTVREHDGEPYHDGLKLTVTAREPRPGLSGETVIETVAPSIRRAYKVIRPGEVIVGYPEREGERTPGTTAPLTAREARPTFQQVTDELAVARAAELARSGDHAGALAALAAAPGSPTVGRLDLTARIHAQLGAYDIADDAWRRAAQLAGAGTFQAERDRIAAERSGRSRRGPAGRLWPLLTALLAVALAATLTVLIVRSPTGQDDASTLADVRAQQTDIVRRIDELQADQQAQPPSAREVLAPVEADLSRRPAIHVRPDPGKLVVLFPDSPFGGVGAQLAPEGEAALGELGRRLAPHTDRIALRVVGHTDEALPRPGGPFADNESLALARALAAARRLADATGQPLESIAVAAAGADRAPFPNTSAQANRTVTIEIVPVSSY